MISILVWADTPNLSRSTAAKYGTAIRLDYEGFRSRLLSVGEVRAEAIVNDGLPQQPPKHLDGLAGLSSTRTPVTRTRC